MSRPEITVHVFPCRNFAAYYSDQLEVLYETENKQINLFTDNIAVIQKYHSDGSVEEYDVALTGSRQENIKYLLNQLAV